MYSSFKFLTFVVAMVQALDLDLELRGTQPTHIGSLPDLKANPDTITVSGHSAGGHFSCMLQIILSETVKGAGCSKGGPFYS